MLVKQFASGGVITVNGAPHIIESVEKHTPSARGAATIYKVRCRNLLTQMKTDLSCKGEDSYDEPDFRQQEVQYLYKEGNDYVFMDVESFEQFPLAAEIIGDDKYYLVEDMEGISALILEDRIVGIRLPDVVELELVECDPAIKGQSATNRGKSAKTQTGLEIQVPEYMEQGEIVRIDTRTGKFLGRVGTKF
ncbi:MAG: elongation factor P [Victivallales bacterium]|jgi:elongation factor P|nr:elongation factor P [Victivallales bacterium]MCR5381299.1 elongation factor P [Lentisphaeria bacterium]MBQ2336801.1 elongation factor P [Victivallales bacterium]MBR4370938.1 elongation factor P [Victivallales bacterium]MBR4417725.1 elongation factor P [Victivallales bacterium]